VTSPFRDRDVALPGALAAMLADELEDTRPSLAVLLGRSDRERLDTLAECYDLATTGSRVEVTLRLMDFFAAPEVLKQMLGRIPNPDWLGSPIMVVELGGVCYWQEVFGYEFGGDDEEDGGGDVVPLMREEERFEEKRMAERLVETGFIYRIDSFETDFEMVAVPEELWEPVWSVGRGWLVDWARRAFHGLRDRGASAGDSPDAPHLQDVGTWLVCEAATGELTLDEGDPHPETVEALRETAGDPDWELERYLDVLFDLSILRRGVDGFMTLGTEYESLLEMERPDFVRDALYEWCGGFVGAEFEERLPKAFGLDESWREQALEILRARGEFIPQWMSFEGVEQERTGAGCLRETAANSPELLARELSIVNGYVWSSKMLWLDMLSMVEPGRTYPLAAWVELEQMIASIGLFSQLGHLIEDPREYFYLPVQRASFVTDPFHTSEFEHWIGEVVDGLLEPLGVAARDDEEGVRLLDDDLRIESPPGWSDEERERSLGEILGRDDFEFSIPTTGGRPLEAVEESSSEIRLVSENAPREASLDRSVDELLEIAQGRTVDRFTGDQIVFAPSVAESPETD